MECIQEHIDQSLTIWNTPIIIMPGTLLVILYRIAIIVALLMPQNMLVVLSVRKVEARLRIAIPLPTSMVQPMSVVL